MREGETPVLEANSEQSDADRVREDARVLF